MSTPFSRGYAVRLDDRVRVLDDGWLFGGSPMRLVRLSPRARELVREVVVVDDDLSQQLAARLLDGNLAMPVLDEVPVPGAGELTVVIPVRDRADGLARTLASLRGLRCVVVDDASHDPRSIAEVATSYDAELVPLDHNVGPGGARNAGLARVRTPHVAFVDSDVTVAPDALLRLARHFADDRVALVGPRVEARSRSATPTRAERFEEHASALDMGVRAGSVAPGSAVPYLPTACVIARTDRLGDGFAGLYVGEDVDLVWRLVEAGQVVRYDPAEVAIHDTRPRLRDRLGRSFTYGTSGTILAARHGDHVAPAVLSPTLSVVAAGVLMRRRLPLGLAAVGAGLAWQSIRRKLPDIADRHRLAAELTARGIGSALRQESALLLRHWWPLAAVAVPISPAVRRALLSAVVVDAVSMTVERRSPAPVGRRLEDLSYGAGLWAGALRARSARCLLPVLSGRGARRARASRAGRHAAG